MKDKWLYKLIVDTRLINTIALTDKEKLSVTSYLLGQMTLEEIALATNMTKEKVEKLCGNVLGKLFFKVKDFASLSSRYDALIYEKEKVDRELLDLKQSFKNRPTLKPQLKIEFDAKVLSLQDIPFSVRAKNALNMLKVLDIDGLRNLTQNKLTTLPGLGVKTLTEIVRRSEEIGIVIS